jgi:hypothetical protein
MNAASEKLQVFKKIIASITLLINEILQEERNFIAELNRNQLVQGEKADNTNMPNYEPNSKAPESPGRIKLFDTGLFYESITPLFNRDEFELSSDDAKADILEGKYGNILGLNEESLILLRERVKKKLIIKINDLL